MILGLHIRTTRNAGDRWSSPIDYFPFDAVGADMRTVEPCKPDLVIYGGGSITASPDFKRWPCKTVAWGVGHHVRKEPWHQEMIDEHKRAASLCDLYFPRDLVDGFDVVPDASCMHTIFDEAHEPKHKVVRYSAARRISVANGTDPHMTNEDGDIEAAVRFIGSGERIITSSYHGAYWAMLLGRKAEIVPWGSKFFYLPYMNLQQCREANHRAYRKVLDGR